MKAMFNIMEKKWIFFIIALAILVVGTASMLFQGLNLDIEFAGGVVITYDIGQEINQQEAEAIAREILGEHASAVQTTQLETGSQGLIVRFSYAGDLATEADRQAFSNEMRTNLNDALAEWLGMEVVSAPRPTEEPDGDIIDINPLTIDAGIEPITIDIGNPDGEVDEVDEADEAVEADEVAAVTNDEEEDVIGIVPVAGTTSNNIYTHEVADISPSTGRDLAQRTLWMLLFAAIVMLIYISIRFEFVTACMLVISLIYNVCVMIAIYTIFQIPVNVSFIAAVLTIVGYTSNDTIVIFDRIRENMRHAKKETYSSVANRSIWQSLTRSINTSVTTLIILCLLMIMSVPSIREFAFPIVMGIIIGTFSSIFIAAPLWATWKDAGIKPAK